jgi:hypothetical protein
MTDLVTGDFEQAGKTVLTAVDFSDQITDFGVIFPNSGYVELLTLTGQYLEAAEKIEWFDESIDLSGWPNEAALISRVRGWLALAGHRYTEAQEYFEAAINRLSFDDESVALSKIGLAGAAFGLGHRGQTRNLLSEALSTSTRNQCYLPMVFALPMTLPILAEGDPDLAIYVYQQVKMDPFLAKAPLFEDLVYRDIPEEISSLPDVKIEGGHQRREALWATAKLVLEKWAGD